SATTAASIVGRVAGRWRLLGSTAAPSGVDTDVVLGLLVARLHAADPELAAQLGAPVLVRPTGRRPGAPDSDGVVDLAMARAALSVAVAEQRPDVATVIVGAPGQHQAGNARGRADPGSVIVLSEGIAELQPAEILRRALDSLQSAPGDSRRGVIRSTATLAHV